MHGSAAHVSFINVTNTGDYLAWAWKCTSSFLTCLDAHRSWARLDRVIDKLARHHEGTRSDQQGSSCFSVHRRQGPTICRSKSSRCNMLPKDVCHGKRVTVVDVDEENSHLVRLESARTPPTECAAVDQVSSGTSDRFGYGILVTLGGCDHLDDLETTEVRWAVFAGSEQVIVRFSYAHSLREICKEQLYGIVASWSALLGWFLRHPCGNNIF
jgi:hypothetical protein